LARAAPPGLRLLFRLLFLHVLDQRLLQLGGGHGRERAHDGSADFSAEQSATPPPSTFAISFVAHHITNQTSDQNTRAYSNARTHDGVITHQRFQLRLPLL
jgi:hypothetical protein